MPNGSGSHIFFNSFEKKNYQEKYRLMTYKKSQNESAWYSTNLLNLELMIGFFYYIRCWYVWSFSCTILEPIKCEVYSKGKILTFYKVSNCPHGGA